MIERRASGATAGIALANQGSGQLVPRRQIPLHRSSRGRHNHWMPVLSTPQFFALTEQMTATERHLKHGIAMIASPRFESADLDVALQSLARGSETLVKLTRVLAELHFHGRVITVGEIRGHRVHEFEPDVRALIAVNAQDVVQAFGWLRMLMDFVTADPVIHELLAIFGAFADKERYHHLDRALNSISPQYLEPRTPVDEAKRRVAPQQAWGDLVSRTAAAMQLSLLEADTAFTVRTRFALSLGAWWELYAAAWVRALGDLGRRSAGIIRPPFEVRPSVADLDLQLTLARP